MEADWNEAARLTLPGPAPNTPPSTLTTLAFDPSHDLLWTGNEYGRVTSLYGAELQKYTSYRGHVSTAQRGSPGNAHVKQLLFCERGVISVSSRSIHLSSRRGLAQWHLCRNSMTDLQCMAFTSRDADELLVAGCQRQLYRIDVDKGTVVETIEPPKVIRFTMMRLAGQYICAASQDGFVHILDPKTLAVARSWSAYAGQVNDMDARGDHLLVCGWGQTHHHGLSLERYVRVYNLKTQKPAPPIHFPQGAAYVRMHPKLSSTCVIVSQTGLINAVDIQNPEIPATRYATSFDGQFMGLELMPSGKGFALADGASQLVLWGSPSKLQFTEYSQPLEFADPEGRNQTMDWSLDTPLNVIGMPHYRDALLSVWPNNLVHQLGLPPPRIDFPDSPRSFEYGTVGRNTRKTRRNQAADVRSHQHRPSDPLAAPKFLSEKPREEDATYEAQRRMSEDLLRALDHAKLDGVSVAEAKFLYRVVEIQYSRFGVEDFDFGYYNKTRYAGLETHIVNSYANPFLQLLRFTPVARNLCLHHAARDCGLPSCLFCELGFLVDMLEKARTPNCQATNFLKTLSRVPGASTQNILEETTSGVALTTMVQNLNRFLFQQLENVVKHVSPGLMGNFHTAFGTIGRNFTQCLHCQSEVFATLPVDSQADKVWYTYDLIYLPKPKGSPGPLFSQVLKQSIERYNQHRGWCLRCNGYKGMISHRAVHCLPAVLMLNAAVASPEACQLWAKPGFLPREIGVIVNNGRFYCYEGQELHFQLKRAHHTITVYELVGFVTDVKTGEGDKSHLVSTIDVGIAEKTTVEPGDWHLFNDFLVHKVPTEDALHFNPQWKLPSIITYQVKSQSHAIDDSWKNSIDSSVLFRSPAQPAIKSDYFFAPLSENEPLPKNGFHVAIDAEFVRLLREEIDVGADGSRTMTRPARSGLARVSVLRGEGYTERVPFIDDYIAIDEPIDDYVTQYSGLHEGDLTAGRSRFKLVSLKEAYKKLWVLLNLGCIFVGHGLSSDFRIINIHVPESQVVDTQDLFTLGALSRRKLSLRFLAWVVLKEEVQKNAEMGHDSIEDARTALKLWRKYLEFQNAGVFNAIMEEVWQTGRATDFKVLADKRLPETPNPSAPNTPLRQAVRMATPGRVDAGSP